MRLLPIPILPLVFCVVGWGCSSTSGNTDGGNSDGGNNGDGGNSQFTFYDLNTGPNDFQLPGMFSMAVAPGDRVGVAYFQLSDGGIDAGILLPDGGVDNTQGMYLHNLNVTYLEWSASTRTVTTPPQYIQQVQISVGISLAFQGNGEPAVSYVGGPDKNMSPFWFQQNATVNYRSAGTTWTEQIVDGMSMDDPPPATDLPNGVDTSMFGVTMGLYPSLVFDGGTAYLAYRDVHTGQFPKQDWGGSDLKVAVGTTPTTWALGGAAWGGNNKQAWGGHNHLVLGVNGWPAVVSDQLPGGGFGEGQNVVFFQDNNFALKPWTPDYEVNPPIAGQIVQGPNGFGTGNLGDTGPSMQYDPVLGYGVAFNCRGCSNGVDTLNFLSSTDGVTWSPVDTFFAAGTGGWWPSVAIDPVLNEPSIAFYICSSMNNIAYGSCPSSQDEIQIAQRVGQNWVFIHVDPDGYFQPQLAYLSTGKRVVVYGMQDGHLRLALEK